MCSFLIQLTDMKQRTSKQKTEGFESKQDSGPGRVNKLENTKYVCLTNVKSGSLCKMEREVLSHMTNGKVWEGCGKFIIRRY